MATQCYPQADTLVTHQQLSVGGVILLHLYAIAGLLLQGLFTVRRSVIDGTFSFKIWISRNWIDVLIGFIAGVIFIEARETVINNFGFYTQPDNDWILYSVTAGYLGREWIFQIMQGKRDIENKK